MSYEVIRFEIEDLAIRDSGSCPDDYVEIKDGGFIDCHVNV